MSVVNVTVSPIAAITVTATSSPVTAIVSAVGAQGATGATGQDGEGISEEEGDLRYIKQTDYIDGGTFN